MIPEPLTLDQIESLALEKGLDLDFSHCLSIDVESQTLFEFAKHQLINSYSVSTAKAGTGNQLDSYQTPLGFHEVAQKIGAECPVNSVFKARRATGELAVINDPKFTQTDCITSRILWLSGLEKGFNLGGDVDSKKRYIYIHGTADENRLGQAVSKGCIRMKNSDMVTLFQFVSLHTVVYIY